MKPRLQIFIRSSLFRYLLTGGLGLLLELIVIAICVRGWGLSAIVGAGISFWIGIAFSFAMQKVFTFRNLGRSTGALTRQGLGYAVLVAVNFAFTVTFVGIMDPIWHAPELWRTFALVITTAWNYLAYKFIIFR